MPLTRKQLFDVATSDPTSGLAHGQYRYLLRHGNPSANERMLLETLLATPTVQPVPPPEPVLRPSDASPSAALERGRRAAADRFGSDDASGKRSGLDVADVEWLRRLPSNPAQLTDRDVEALREVAGRASTATEQALVAQVAEPLQRHRERHYLHQVVGRTPGALRSSGTQQLAIDLLAAKIRDETPDLHPAGASAAAREELQAVWKRQAAERQAAHEAARARFVELAEPVGTTGGAA